MNNISYTISRDGSEIGRWCGKSIWDNGTVRKEGQIYLGKVIDKERLIFFTREKGFYIFDPATRDCRGLTAEDMPISPPLDKRERPPNPIVTFGGSYFLGALLRGIEYDKVLNVLNVPNNDTMGALLHYYCLTDSADVHAPMWFRQSYARLMFPHANLYSQRISDLYARIGLPINRRAFFKEHIAYLKTILNDEFCIIVDSTGCQNAIKFWKTRVSKHENDVNIEFRIVLVVHRETGLPVYYEIIPGNVVDISTIDRIRILMEAYGITVTMASGDAGYAAPAAMERLILMGTDILMRLNPTYEMYKTVLEEHEDEIDPSRKDHLVRYRNRLVQIVKTKAVIATEPGTGKEVNGYIYLCRDMQAYHSKSKHLISTDAAKKMTAEEIYAECQKYGVFAIVTTIDMAAEDVLPQYYMRQAIEQFFDFAKNLGKMMPVRNHREETIEGHMMMSFITTFLCVMIKNRMNIMDSPNVALPRHLARVEISEDCIEIQLDNEKVEVVMRQEVIESVAESSPGALFAELNYLMADVFDEETDIIKEVIPAPIQKEANDYFKAFGLNCPRRVLIGINGLLVPELPNDAKDTCSKKKAFACRPLTSDEEILRRREDKERKKLQKRVEELGIPVSPLAPQPEKQARKPGRPKGSKNKKTLEREAELARQKAQAQGQDAQEKRGRGRPKGSRNKKTLEREAELARQKAQAQGQDAQEKRGRGRPKGSRNKKTLEREAELARQMGQTQEQGAQKKRGRGRPKGSRNKKTLEREAELARQMGQTQEQDAQEKCN